MKKAKLPKQRSAVGAACTLLALAGIAAFVLYAVLDTFYPGLIILYGLSAYEPDPFERAFLFWFSGLALLATVGIAVGLSLLLQAPVKTSEQTKLFPKRAWVLALMGLALVLVVKFAVLHNSPTMDDENVYDFTARLLTEGRLSLPTTIPAEFFEDRHGVKYRNGRLYPMYPHGWPALLALGYLVHVPWLIGPLVVVAVLLLAIDFARRIYGPATARLAVLFFLTSPFFILTGATDLSPLAAALGALLVVSSASRYLDEPRMRWLWLCGAGGGLALQSRPLNAVSLTPFFLYLLYRIWKEGGVRARTLGHAAALTGPVGISVALYLAANYTMNGNPFVPGYVLEFAARGVKSGSPLGFGAVYPIGVGGNGLHTVGQGILQSGLNLVRLNTWLLGWPFSLLLVLAAPVNLWTRLILIALSLHLVLYATFYNPGLCLTGPLYYYEYGTLLLVLAASGLRRLGEWRGTLPRALVPAILFVNLVMFTPTYVRSLYHMTEGTGLLAETLETKGIHHAVVFVRNVQAPWVVTDLYKSYAYHPRTNASFDDDVVILNDRGVEKDRAALHEYFPGRQGYTYGVDPGWIVQLNTLE